MTVAALPSHPFVASVRPRTDFSHSTYHADLESQRHALHVGQDAEGDGFAAPRPAPDHRRPDDACARVPEEGMHRAEALARERADHLHPRGRAEVLDWRG